MGDIKTGLPISITDANYNGTTNTRKASVSATGALKVTVEESLSGAVCASGSYVGVASGNTEIACQYTVGASQTFNLKSIVASASAGPCKVIVDYTDGSVVVDTLATGFFSSVSPTVQINFPATFELQENYVVRVRIRNNAVAAQDVYASIMGQIQS